MKANVTGVTVERVKGGFRVCGTVSVPIRVNGVDLASDALPFCITVKDSTIKRALMAVRDEWRRFYKRVRSWANEDGQNE